MSAPPRARLKFDQHNVQMTDTLPRSAGRPRLRQPDYLRVGDRPPRTVFARMLTDIVETRAQEFLMLIRDELRRGGLESQIPAGIVFTGGGAHLRRPERRVETGAEAERAAAERCAEAVPPMRPPL